ncbi:PREDICTED: bifunctional protein FolD 2-like [Nicotiana attenuata]|uniref:Bifunctional protein fold 1, mitochondrial n=1 Tax=Nicotiana attenuata TaxID=49451 RepID=A0A314LE99_NICAT|nr:PREDICTED: bifunctional protein FolD 2-like [Nicotiana attenuata]OIT39893.1 bifunctional protein fold 1, mitochondrial [Nicotiana attenuata]
MQDRAAMFYRMLEKAFHSSAQRANKHRLRFPPLTPVDLPDIWIPRHDTSIAKTCSPHLKTNSICQTARVLEGKPIANDINSRIAAEICEMKNTIGKTPGLGVILVGGRKDSQSFVHIKMKACMKVGIAPFTVELPEDCTEAELFDAVSSFNENPLIHGVVVQLPLPKHLDEEKIISYVSPEKDVDGFHPTNVGNLAMRGREPSFIPCASKSCIELLLRNDVEIKGKNVVVVGRSKLGGLPTSLLMQRHHATVTTVHAFTGNPEQVTCGADILVSDIGVPNMIRGHWLKPGVIVVDMGANSVEDTGSLRGHRLIGDVCYEEAIVKASAITPVPGGVGPITISMLLSNTVDAAKRTYRNT